MRYVDSELHRGERYPMREIATEAVLFVDRDNCVMCSTGPRKPASATCNLESSVPNQRLRLQLRAWLVKEPSAGPEINKICIGLCPWAWEPNFGHCVPNVSHLPDNNSAATCQKKYEHIGTFARYKVRLIKFL